MLKVEGACDFVFDSARLTQAVRDQRADRSSRWREQATGEADRLRGSAARVQRRLRPRAVVWGVVLGLVLFAATFFVLVLLRVGREGGGGTPLWSLPVVGLVGYFVVRMSSRGALALDPLEDAGFPTVGLILDHVRLRSRLFILRSVVALVLFHALARPVFPRISTLVPEVITLAVALSMVAAMLRPIRQRDVSPAASASMAVLPAGIIPAALSRTEGDSLQQVLDRSRQRGEPEPPVTHEDLVVAASSSVWLAWRIDATAKASELVITNGTAAIEAFDAAVGLMERHFSERRFNAFWEAVESSTIAQERVRQWYERAGQVASLWAPPGQRVQFRSVVEMMSEAKIACEAVTLRLDDGTPVIVPSANPYSDFNDYTSRPLEPEWVSAPRIQLDPEALVRLESCLARYSEVLQQADQDFEMASIGQHFKTRATMIQGFDRLERAMYMMAASICSQIRASTEAMQGSIAAAAGQVSAAVGAASTANVNAIGEVEARLRSIEGISGIIASRR
ncbi:MAG: hypothetical protein IPK64_17060 [bacterium]|nr:hypothetical protein [bacterium]